jgi:hypothetical protein
MGQTQGGVRVRTLWLGRANLLFTGVYGALVWAHGITKFADPPPRLSQALVTRRLDWITCRT